MGLVMVRCPATGRAISTGMAMERARFRQMPVFFARCHCAACGVEHEWFAGHAWVEEPTSELERAG